MRGWSVNSAGSQRSHGKSLNRQTRALGRRRRLTRRVQIRRIHLAFEIRRIHLAFTFPIGRVFTCHTSRVAPTGTLAEHELEC